MKLHEKLFMVLLLIVSGSLFSSCEKEEKLDCTGAAIFYELNKISETRMQIRVYTDLNHQDCPVTINGGKILFLSGNDTLSTEYYIADGNNITFKKEYYEWVNIPPAATAAIWIFNNGITKYLSLKDGGIPPGGGHKKLDNFYQFYQVNSLGEKVKDVDIFIKIPDLVQNTSTGILQTTPQSKFIFKSGEDWTFVQLQRREYRDVSQIDNITNHSKSGFILNANILKDVFVSNPTLRSETRSLRIILHDNHDKVYHARIPSL